MNIAFQCKLRVNKLTLSPLRPSPSISWFYGSTSPYITQSGTEGVRYAEQHIVV